MQGVPKREIKTVEFQRSMRPDSGGSGHGWGCGTLLEVKTVRAAVADLLDKKLGLLNALGLELGMRIGWWPPRKIEPVLLQIATARIPTFEISDWTKIDPVDAEVYAENARVLRPGLFAACGEDDKPVLVEIWAGRMESLVLLPISPEFRDSP